jgi:hypothetical protein
MSEPPVYRCTNVVHALRSRETGTKRGLTAIDPEFPIPPFGWKMKLSVLFAAMRSMSCPDTDEIVCNHGREYCFHSESPGKAQWDGVEIETIYYKTGKEICERTIMYSISSPDRYDHVVHYVTYVNGALVFPLSEFPISVESTMSVTECAPETHVFFTGNAVREVVVPGCVVRYMRMLRDIPKELKVSYIQVAGFRLIIGSPREMGNVLYIVNIHDDVTEDVPRLEFFTQE